MGGVPMEEVRDYIEMPKFGDHAKKAHTDDYKKIMIDADITRELGEYVTCIANMYKHNPFHNFEHACHVTMSGKSQNICVVLTWNWSSNFAVHFKSRSE